VICEPAYGPFLLIRLPDAELLRERLAGVGIAVRRGDTFPGPVAVSRLPFDGIAMRDDG
jgi:hypothetical protein